ncbi:MAG: hypothetical protein AB8B61_01430 [Cyclobacteriaceae bacterium]
MKKLSIVIVLAAITQLSFAKYPKAAILEAKVYKQELSLTKSQAHEVAKLLSNKITDLRELKSLRSNSVAQYKTETSSTNKAFQKSLSGILTTEQAKHYASHKSEINNQLRYARLFH